MTGGTGTVKIEGTTKVPGVTEDHAVIVYSTVVTGAIGMLVESKATAESTPVTGERVAPRMMEEDELIIMIYRHAYTQFEFVSMLMTISTCDALWHPIDNEVRVPDQLNTGGTGHRGEIRRGRGWGGSGCQLRQQESRGREGGVRQMTESRAVMNAFSRVPVDGSMAVD